MEIKDYVIRLDSESVALDGCAGAAICRKKDDNHYESIGDTGTAKFYMEGEIGALVNSSPPEQNGCHFAEDTFMCIFLIEKFCILIKISMNFFLRVQLTKPSIGSDNGLAPNKHRAIIWINAYLIHWRMYAPLVGDELTHCPLGDLVVILIV